MKRKTIFVNGARFSVLVGDSFFLRLRGLLGRTLDKNHGFLLTPCNSVHTWFMSYPIDILYLDKDLRLLHCDRQVAPWRMLRPVRGAKQVLELPCGTVNSEVNTILEVEDNASICKG